MKSGAIEEFPIQSIALDDSMKKSVSTQAAQAAQAAQAEQEAAGAPLRWDVIGMFVGTTAVALVAVPWYGYVHGFTGVQWLLFGIFASLNNLAITAGYHRLWSHKAYKANIVVRVLMALGGAFAFQNSIRKWASDHRRHHGHVDDEEHDPYSARRGLWFSHLGWMIRDYPSTLKNFDNIKDLDKDPIVRWQHKYYLPLALAANIGLPVILGLIFGDIWGMLLLVGFLRLVVCHHTTFFINSLAHFWGTQPYSTKNTARDNPILALLTFGEGYHNFHHAFPGDYRNAIRWWQWDPTKWLIASLSVIGLSSNLRTISNDKIQAGLIASKANVPPR